MNWWAIDTNLPLKAKVRLPHHWSAVSQGQATFVAHSADKQSSNYDAESSNHDPGLSKHDPCLRPQGSNFSNVKWRVIYTNLPVKTTVRLPHRSITVS